MEFIASLSKDSYANILDQYHPTNKAARYPEINRPITSKELEEAVKITEKRGLTPLKIFGFSRFVIKS